MESELEDDHKEIMEWWIYFAKQSKVQKERAYLEQKTKHLEDTMSTTLENNLTYDQDLGTISPHIADDHPHIADDHMKKINKLLNSNFDACFNSYEYPKGTWKKIIINMNTYNKDESTKYINCTCPICKNEIIFENNEYSFRCGCGQIFIHEHDGSNGTLYLKPIKK